MERSPINYANAEFALAAGSRSLLLLAVEHNGRSVTFTPTFLSIYSRLLNFK